MWFVVFIGLKYVICVCLLCAVGFHMWWKYNYLCAKQGIICDLGIDGGDMLSSTWIGGCGQSWLGIK